MPKWANARYVAQQTCRCSVYIDADGVDATHHSIVEGVFELFLVYIVLVLTDSDGFRVYLD